MLVKSVACNAIETISLKTESEYVDKEDRKLSSLQKKEILQIIGMQGILKRKKTF